jgi:predicted lipoprotein with Yx(FWY)xxD motif
MRNRTVLGLLISGFMMAAVPALAQAVMPGVMGKTTMGQAMVDAKGMALYTYEKDAGGKSMCNGDCAKEWPPLMAAADAKASGDWTIVTRDDGTMQWAYKGKPLYTYLEDKKADDVMGDKMNGFHLAM